MTFSIRTILIGGTITLLFVTVAAIQLSSYLTTQDVLLGHARQMMRSLATDTIDHSTTFLKPAERAADLTQRLADGGIVSSGTPDRLERFLFEQLQIHPHISGLYYGGADGSFQFINRENEEAPAPFRSKRIFTDAAGHRVVTLKWYDEHFGTVRRETVAEDPYDPRTRPWYQKAVAQRRLIWTDPYIFYSAKQPGITIASPVYDAEANLRGVVGVDIEISAISRFLAALSIGKNGSAFILNQNNDVIAHPDPQKIKTKAAGDGANLRFTRIDELDDPISRAAFQSLKTPLNATQGTEPVFTSFSLNGTTYLAVFAPFGSDNWPWTIGLYLPENDYLGPLHDNQHTNIHIALGIALLAGLLSFFGGRGIARSLGHLRANAQVVKAGDYDGLTPVPPTFQEIAEVGDAMDTMAATLQEKKAQNAQLAESLRQTSIATIMRLSTAAEFKDSDTGEHIQRMSDVSALIAYRLGQPEKWVEMFRYAVAMHDVGKIGVPDHILLKQGPLSDEEWKVMRSHSGIGASILKNSDSDLLEMARIIALHHHEKWDGTGYPQELKGEAIPLEARICAIADVFDALVSKRCYKAAVPFETSLDLIRKGVGSHFDPDCVAAFFACEDDIRAMYGQPARAAE